MRQRREDVALVVPGQLLQGLVHRQDLHHIGVQGPGCLLQWNARHLPATFRRLAASRIVHQPVAHRLRAEGEEVASTLPRAAVHPLQTEVGPTLQRLTRRVT